MTAVLDRPTTTAPLPREGHRPPRQRHSRRRWDRWRPPTDVLWLAPILLVSTVVNAIGLTKAPQRVDDEGTYMAQAYAVEKFGELAHYTYWYDHPPLGWLQIAAMTLVTRAFDWPISAVAAGRVIMLGVSVVSAVLIWMLARRLDLSRFAAAAAVLLFSLSPLAVSFHRMVYLDNLAVMWTLAALVLAASRHHQLGAFCGSAACLATAVLTKETFILGLPAVGWLMWRHAVPATRRYTLAMASALFVLMGCAYLAFALLKSELIPGRQRVSLFEGIAYQLVSRPGSGSVWQENTASNQTVNIWLGLDTVLLAGGLIAAVALMFVARFRPLAVGLLILAAMLLRTGYLPIPYVIAAIPFAALLIAAAADLGLRQRRLRPVAAVGVGAAVLMGAPAWATDLRGLTHNDADRPMREAQAWIVENVDRDDRILVDDAVWVDLVEAGFPRDSAVWFFKADTDPAVMRKAPGGWRDYDYVMVTSSVRATLDIGRRGDVTPYPVVTAAAQHGDTAAVFGEGYNRVWILRVDPTGGDGRDEARAAPRATPPPAPPAHFGQPAPVGGAAVEERPAEEPPAEEPSDEDPVDEEQSEEDSAADEEGDAEEPTPAPAPADAAEPTPSPAPAPTKDREPVLRIKLGPGPKEVPR